MRVRLTTQTDRASVTFGGVLTHVEVDAPHANLFDGAEGRFADDRYNDSDSVVPILSATLVTVHALIVLPDNRVRAARYTSSVSVGVGCVDCHPLGVFPQAALPTDGVEVARRYTHCASTNTFTAQDDITLLRLVLDAIHTDDVGVGVPRDVRHPRGIDPNNDDGKDGCEAELIKYVSRSFHKETTHAVGAPVPILDRRAR